MDDLILEMFKGLDTWAVAQQELKTKGVKEYVVDPDLLSIEHIKITDGVIYIPPFLEPLVSELLKGDFTNEQQR